MPAYAVRLKPGTVHPHDLVGVFFARDPDHLAEFVDECCDAGACEYARLPAGGIYCTEPAIPVPYGNIGEDETIEMLPEATVTDSWWETFLGREAGLWHPLERPAYAQVLMDHGLCP